ncbi:MAG: sec-independent protein translocase protein TatB [Rhodocyclaceae bacterium]|nr:MAG: sec-independent protein translocase protein TatB [Rhodocyclaceae bacterium]TND04863.1 MAG: sec-independent protein translocase protein TatB [Rhodocyclaceae bacterium]
MFDVGLSELMVIAAVALVVIGPERLPKVARTAGLLLGRLQRYVSDVKSDINREMQLDELKKLQQQMTDQVTSLEASVTHEMREVESSVNDVIEPLAADAAVSPAPTPEAIPVAAEQPAETLAPATAAAETLKS